jgi:FkbM family methyltransferase
MESQAQDSTSLSDGAEKCAGKIFSVDGALFFLPERNENFLLRRLERTGRFLGQNVLQQAAAQIRPNPIVVDTGANFGNESIFFAVEAGAEKIYSFEGNPNDIELLKKNVGLNNLGKKINVNPFILSDETKTVKLRSRSPFSHEREITVAARPLDSFDLGPKIDLLLLKGAELGAATLAGATETLKKVENVLLFSGWSTDSDAIVQKLEESGFEQAAKFGQSELFQRKTKKN